jgi:NAD(P)-dependent dehydrogenase (short-subunit alcohol dehydrogenase family)
VKVWFITGASRGFGRLWTVAALERGDLVVATARDASALDDVVAKYDDKALALPLDVTDRAAAFATVARAHEHFGRLDVVVNNAGYSQHGMVEELSEADVRDQIETNLFGTLWVTQAALPFLRAQGFGHIMQISSIGGITAWPSIGMYNASKWALEGITQAMAEEVAAFGVRVTLVEPSGYATDQARTPTRRAAPIPDYDTIRESPTFAQRRVSMTRDPAAAAAALLKLVDLDNPPLRVFFGDGALNLATEDYERRLAEWRKWEHLSREADGVNER